MPAVCGTDAFGHLKGDIECLYQRHRAVVEDVPERASGHQLHHEHVGVVDRENVEDRDDMRIVERGGCPRFVQEACATLLVVALVGREDLQRHAAIETKVERFITTPIPPAPSSATTL